MFRAKISVNRIQKRLNYLFVFFCLSTPAISFAQNNGLHFYGQETVQDKRTSLDLTADEEMCFDGDFELSFDLYFTPKFRDYYGYVFRIIEENGHNIDLIYDQKAFNTQNFKLVIGDKFSNIAFNLPEKLLFKSWNHFTISYRKEFDELVFTNGNQKFSQKNAGFQNSGCYKVLFGANHYKRFKTTDVPMMNIKNISVLDHGKLKFFWPLDEFKGDEAFDRIGKRRATVENPLWINAMHTNWKLVKSVVITGHPSVAFNQQKQIIHIVGPSELYNFSVGDENMVKLEYASKRDIAAGNQSVYDQLSGRLYNVFIDQKKASYFDLPSGRWDKDFERPTRLTKYWHSNKFISKADSALYVMGGYGQLVYKNEVQKYDLNNKKWTSVKYKGDAFNPRYLAGLGVTDDGNTAYIMGGHGSITGEQMLNPTNYYDLIRYQVKTQMFKKVYTLKSPENDFAFANSLVIDSPAKSFYGLVFANNKFKTHLQLIKGSLTSPTYQLIGGYIPYLFHDIRSYADLYWCPELKKLVAVTLFTREDNNTEIKIYTIEFPPNGLGIAIGEARFPIHNIIILTGLVCLLIGATYYFYKRRKIAQTETLLSIPAHNKDIPAPKQYQTSIHLFGNLQLLDNNGDDVTKMLSPLLKELLLLILLYSMRKEGGISSNKLDELLWFGKSEKVARNNRSVNIAKLKGILSNLEYCNLNKDSGYWKIDIDFNHVYIDYFHYLQITKEQNQGTKQQILELLKVLQRGPFLSNIEYDWLDDIKSEVSHKVIDLLLNYTTSADTVSQPEFIIEIADHVFYFDRVNEDALKLKCKALSQLGKHTLAKNTFEKFQRVYKAIYTVDFEKSFQSIIEA
ncbi:Kelch repeat-containing protein [Mucilaginibacter terrae]|uniref:Two-component SAPR family response regulator n=1 Tax=Mucilaginibacter terrae TaxID=1955052 RepID=A0ABU3GMI4_9SPHI|nr:galactose oxidase [Mucilaginibacter terrae]MDT3400994.1 two-component SAPR family response regulator [Mucilaginibacter terrae]